ncbi:MAG: LLM class flavin-dependent oxidoreductase, partial [Rhodospirillaceae bacterium]|nr:LLM class flavin-dependent oxidoreductase [Rhodospirillaceae bacterium]
MIKSWIFEFLYAPEDPEIAIDPSAISKTFAAGFEKWERAEALGFEGIFFSEHHFSLSYSPSPNLMIAALAQRTKRMRLGTMGMVLPFYQPWRIVEEICMLDHLSGGRLEIGCAAGVPQEISRGGLEASEARERYNEMLEFVDAALAEPVFSHHGKYWNFDNLSIMPRPLQQPSPPKWTTVVSNPSAERSAQRNSKICTGFESVARITEIFDAYRHEADRQDRTAGPDDLAVRRNVSIARDESEAHEAASIALAIARRVMAADPRVNRENSSVLDAPKAGAGFSLHEDEFIAGTPEQVAEQIIEQSRSFGAGHFLGTIGRGLDEKRAEMIEMYGTDVIPILKRAKVLEG